MEYEKVYVRERERNVIIGVIVNGNFEVDVCRVSRIFLGDKRVNIFFKKLGNLWFFRCVMCRIRE